MTRTFPYFRLESGHVLSSVQVGYHTWGTLNKRGDNAVVVCHSLTSNSDAADWWPGLIGPGCLLDTNRYYVICANTLGSCYGTTGPASTRPDDNVAYRSDFPNVSIRDTVRLHKLLLDRLGVRSVVAAIGGSMGGMQVLEWAFMGDFVKALIPIAVGGRHSAWCVGWSEAQRQAIYADPNWNNGEYTDENPPAAGLAAARMSAMISYRTRQSFVARFGRIQSPDSDRFEIQRYLAHHGNKLVNRFDAGCYVALTKAMDTHDVARDRGPYEDVIRSIKQRTLVIGIDSDVLYPIEEQHELATHLPNGRLEIIHSMHGHDAFLIEFDQLEALVKPFLEITNTEAHGLAA